MAKTQSLKEPQRTHTFRSEHYNSARGQLKAAIIFIRCPVQSRPRELQDPSGGENRRYCNIFWRQNNYDILRKTVTVRVRPPFCPQTSNAFRLNMIL
jgi:hypothetical protein